MRIDMEIISAADFQRKLGHYQDRALVEPLLITRNGRERLVILSVEEYRRLKRRDREVLTLDDFTEEDIAALEKTRAPAKAAETGKRIKRWSEE
jgi:prevent-host-death family protein